MARIVGLTFLLSLPVAACGSTTVPVRDWGWDDGPGFGTLASLTRDEACIGPSTPSEAWPADRVACFKLAEDFESSAGARTGMRVTYFLDSSSRILFMRPSRSDEMCPPSRGCD